MTTFGYKLLLPVSVVHGSFIQRKRCWRSWLLSSQCTQWMLNRKCETERQRTGRQKMIMRIQNRGFFPRYELSQRLVQKGTARVPITSPHVTVHYALFICQSGMRLIQGPLMWLWYDCSSCNVFFFLFWTSSADPVERRDSVLSSLSTGSIETGHAHLKTFCLRGLDFTLVKVKWSLHQSPGGLEIWKHPAKVKEDRQSPLADSQ